MERENIRCVGGNRDGELRTVMDGTPAIKLVHHQWLQEHPVITKEIRSVEEPHTIYTRRILTAECGEKIYFLAPEDMTDAEAINHILGNWGHR